MQWMDSLYAWAWEHALFPVWEGVVRRRPTVSHLQLLDRTQWLPPEELARYQLDELKRLLAHAGANVPYYKDLFHAHRFDPRAVTSREDLAALPLLTREIIRERYDDLVDPAHRGKNICKGTSGSTGVPLKFEYCLSSESWRQAIKLRAYGWAGYRPGARTMHYWAQLTPIPRDRKGIKIRLDRGLRRERWVNSMRQDDASLRAAAEEIRRFKPHVIIAFTQACAQLARFINDHGLRDWDDVPILCGAEAVLSADRAALVRAFGPGIFDTYGSRETMLLACECEAHDGLHLSEENLLVEIVRDGRAAPLGESGDVVVTDLHNYGMPLIRYANGDLAAMSASGPCACGRGLRKITRVEGRRADTLRDVAGNPIPGILVHVLFADARRDLVRQFQAVQRASGQVVLRVVRGGEWSQPLFDEAVNRFADYLRGIPITVEYLDTIAAGPNGKRRTIVVEQPSAG
jgi:phenylacetate-coenzyme A ligase PaaK-like adenylate-forming protein